LKNIGSKINKANSKKITIENNENQCEVEEFHKKIDFQNLSKDIDDHINLERINSLESVAICDETKRSKVKISQSPIRKTRQELEKK